MNKRSEEYSRRALKFLAGGGSCREMSFQRAGSFLVIAARASGSKFYDVDDREYTDYYLGEGAHILGHANRQVVLSAKKHAERGLSFGLTSKAEIDLAAYLAAHVPSMEKMRFVNSAEEARDSSLCLARYATGRKGVICFEGAQYWPEEGREREVLPYNNPEAFERLLKERPGEFGCVLLEPVSVHHGMVPARQEFLDTVCRLVKDCGMVLIFDEVRTGFRGLPGCAQSVFNIRPDLTCLGSVIGGGFSIGAYGGRADLMRILTPEGSLDQFRSLSASPVILRAGMMALRLMTDAFYRALNQKAQNFAEQMNAFFSDQDIALRVGRYYSMMRLCPVNEGSPAALSSWDRDEAGGGYARLAAWLLSRGIYFPAGASTPFFISGKHSKKDLLALRQEMEAFFRNNREMF